MGVDADDEILQDFLVEAGEILEQLSEQLVELESRPDDMDLLNAIFRGFHTVKGGAGFLQLNELVECCHSSENVFDMLRKGVRLVDAELMDVVLQGLDAINGMFAQVREGSELTPASPELLEALHRLADPAAAPAAPVAPTPVPAAPAPGPVATEKEQDLTDAEFESLLDAIGGPETAADGGESAGDEITDAEFENLLDQLHGKGQFKPETLPASDAAAGDSITESEFENLLDQLHGKGQFKPDVLAGQEQAPAAGKTAAGDDITDDEFEALLDQLHGKGQFKPEQVASEPPKAAAPAPQSAAVKPPAAVPTESAPAARPAAAAPAKAPAAIESETTVRVDTARLDEIMNMVGELVLVRNRLVRLGLNSGDEELAKAVSSLDVVTGDLQTSVMKTRMQPIKKVFGRFPRQVRDLSRQLKKEINLELVGEETDLDKNLVEALADPLVHLVRNAVDHGIEMPEERLAAGKPRTGKVVLSAEQEGDHILLLITDDGKGMDANILRAKAVEKGMLDKDAADRLSDTECYNLIFAPGFSTKKEISDVSGRGVGMDVVKTRIAQLNGTVFVDSTPGKGSRIVIKVPLTLAIMPTLMVMLDDQAFAFPLVNVKEIFHLDLSHTNVVDGQEVIIVRDKALPLFYLKQWLVPGFRNAVQKEGHVVIIAIGNQQIGFVVDQLVGQEEVVIKPLGKMLQGTPGLAGASITSDGSIALILDVPSMLKHYARRG
ncbi:chemotaxis protein CheA [Pseudomonas flexibilis]|uniref:Chemotaxis protein CheA n=1 Tax=Pseudomonas flexibilis TaxID=706570 RepID=A0A0B3C1U8_9PSED|nr:chemotaxis protein CheA [Pseudomonas flexibilis]KHO65512.1 chemotaxis protein CheA [Pseudomonas flexibilis]SCX81518.1 two-component system, chemotaxis family, sensor kinase CheA [Pseudomonas flexibilis]